MADPRKASTSRVGTEPKRQLTFKADGTDIVYDATQPNGSAVVGRAVMISGNGIVRLTADASPVDGKLLAVEPDGYCAVQTAGVVELPSSGTVTVGTKVVGALSGGTRGYIRSQAAATLAEVAVARQTVYDVSDAANVAVALNS
jgi:hypothetical protein